jgi:uncharacterized protein YidB (DUF937 family)
MIESRPSLAEVLGGKGSIALAIKGNGQTSAVAAGAVDALARAGGLGEIEAAFGDSGAGYIAAGAGTRQTDTVRKVFERLCHYDVVRRSLGRVARCGVDLAKANYREEVSTYPAMLDLDALTGALHKIFELERLAEEGNMDVVILSTSLDDFAPQALNLNEYLRGFDEGERRMAALKALHRGGLYPVVAGPPMADPDGRPHVDGGILADPAMEAVRRGFDNVIYVNNFPSDPGKRWFDSRLQKGVLSWLARHSGASTSDIKTAIAQHAAELNEFNKHLSNGGTVPQKDDKGNVTGRRSNVHVIRPDAASYPGSAFLSRDPERLRALSIAGANAVYAALGMPEMVQSLPAPDQSRIQTLIDLAGKPFASRHQTDQLAQPAGTA